MTCFAIIELDDGMTIVTLDQGQTPEDAAVTQGGVLVDAGPYATYEDACDALAELEGEPDEDERF